MEPGHVWKKSSIYYNILLYIPSIAFPLAIYLLWFKDYSAYLQETTNTQVDYVFSATGSGTGQKEFFKSNVIWVIENNHNYFWRFK